MEILDIPRAGHERVQWWAEFWKVIADETWRMGEVWAEHGGDDEDTAMFMIEFGDWVKRGVDIAVEQALTFRNATR